MPGHLLVDDTRKDFPFTKEHRALSEVSEVEKAILDQERSTWQKDLATQKKEREKTCVKGKVQKLKGETQMEKEILTNAVEVEEEGATAKALRVRDKAAAAVMNDADEDNE